MEGFLGNCKYKKNSQYNGYGASQCGAYIFLNIGHVIADILVDGAESCHAGNQGEDAREHKNDDRTFSKNPQDSG